MSLMWKRKKPRTIIEHQFPFAPELTLDITRYTNLNIHHVRLSFDGDPYSRTEIRLPAQGLQGLDDADPAAWDEFAFEIMTRSWAEISVDHASDYAARMVQFAIDHPDLIQSPTELVLWDNARKPRQDLLRNAGVIEQTTLIDQQTTLMNHLLRLFTLADGTVLGHLTSRAEDLSGDGHEWIGATGEDHCPDLRKADSPFEPIITHSLELAEAIRTDPAAMAVFADKFGQDKADRFTFEVSLNT